MRKEGGFSPEIQEKKPQGESNHHSGGKNQPPHEEGEQFTFSPEFSRKINHHSGGNEPPAS